jgi:hypothetical protein
VPESDRDRSHGAESPLSRLQAFGGAVPGSVGFWGCRARTMTSLGSAVEMTAVDQGEIINELRCRADCAEPHTKLGRR